MRPANNNFIGRTYSNKPRPARSAKRYSDFNGIKTFSIVKSYGVIGAVFVLAAVSLYLILPEANTLGGQIANIGILAYFGCSGAYSILSLLFSKLYISSDKLLYINFFGLKTELFFKDIKSASFRRYNYEGIIREVLILSCGWRNIRISARFYEYKKIKSIIREKCPEVFPEQDNK